MRRRNRELYDGAEGELWSRMVYDPVHGGRAFINMCGWSLFERVLAEYPLAAGDRLLDLGAGTGEAAAAIAELTDATVVAVEMNPLQAERIRRRAAGLGRGAVEVVEADAADIRLDRPVDLAVSVDTLMLVPSWESFLVPTRALSGGRHRALVATTILGEGLSVDERALFWREDGMISLPTRADAEAALRAAGFERVRLEDRTADARACLAAMDRAIADSEARGDVPQDVLADWRRMNDIYASAFAAGRLLYAELHATLAARRG